MSYFEGTLKLKSPLTKECWDKIADVELENTERMWFTTPSEKRVEYIKASVLDKIKAEATIIKISYTDHDKDTYRRGVNDVLKIIDKYKADKEGD